MPTVTVNRADVGRDEAMEAISQQLGQAYTIKPGHAPDVFQVKTSAMSEAKVHMRQNGGATEFHVHGMGLIIGRLVNELVIARKVADAISKAPGLAGSA